ncbi:phage tail spike protein [Oceanobacillus jeddahense]|uniref:phage tail spike protein n=1 Tax=Oceanobacillus jeddahense TaxID=1462527 RepID=UPI0036449D19
MYPILYKSNETNFTHNGIGFLRDAITVYPEEELNGYSELTIEYDADGFLADEIKNGMIIKAKANDKQQPQLFRIYSHVKDHSADQIIINGRHITNDLADNFVEALEIRNMTTYQAMKAIQERLAYPTRFNFSSTNTTTTSSTNIYRNNPLQMVAGTEGSILQHWGGQIERDNFDLIMHRRRGSDDGVKVLYKKNLTGLQATFDDDSVVTRIYPFKYVEETEEERARLITVPGKYIDSPNIDKYPHIKILPIDASSEEGIENSTDLYNAYKDYFSNEGKDKDLPSVSMEVDFEHLWETEEYKDVAALELVGLGDTITVGHSKLGLDLKATIVKIEYDAIAEKNRKVSAGNVRANFTDNVNQNANDLGVIGENMNKIDQKTNEAIRAANGKNTIYYGPDEPIGDNLIKGDMWFRIVDGEYTRTYIYDGVQWQLSIDMESKEAKETANEARNRANDANEKANLATNNANEAIQEAQGAFDKAQESLTKSNDASSEASIAKGIAEATDSLVKAIKTTVDGHSTEITATKTELGYKMNTVDANNRFATQSQLTATSNSLQSRIAEVQWGVDQLPINANNLLLDKFTDYLYGALYFGAEEINAETLTLSIQNSEYQGVWDISYIIIYVDGTFTEGFLTSAGGSETIEETKEISSITFFVEDATVEDFYAAKIQLEIGDEVTPWGMPPQDLITGVRFNELEQTVDSFGVRIGNSEGEISQLKQTSQSFATRIQNAEGSISTLTQTAQGLQTRVQTAEGNISTVTQLASTLQSKLSDAEGNINTLTQTATSLQSTIKGVRDDLDELEIGARNFLQDSEDERAGTTFDYDLNDSSLSPGDIVTLSFDVESNSDAEIQYYFRQGTTGNDVRSIQLNAGKSRYQMTFKVPDYIGGTHFRIRSQTGSLSIKRAQLEKGNKATDWKPAPEDMATQSQISQLSDNINLRVQKNDIINQINISTEDILISGKKLILDGDTTVNGSFRVENANITSLNAGKITGGTFDGGKVNVINVSANSIVGGILQSQNSNTTFNMNSGLLTMRNVNFVLGNGAMIEFTNVSNRIQYNDTEGGVTRSSGFGVGKSLSGFPFSYSGTTGASNLDTLSPYWSGAIWNTTRAITDGASNSISGFRFQFRAQAVDWDRGLEIDFNGSPSITPINGASYNYDLGNNDRMFNDLYIRRLRSVQSFDVRNVASINKGWLFETSESGGTMSIRGLNGGSYTYVLGDTESYNHFSYGYITNLRAPSSGNSSVGLSSRPYTFGHFDSFNVYGNLYAQKVNETSDRRKKKNIKNTKLGLAFINQLNPVDYEMIDSSTTRTGFIAQEMSEVLNNHNYKNQEIVSEDGQGYLAIGYTQLIAPLARGLQELDTKVDSKVENLEEIIEKQAFEIADLKQRLHKLEVA